MAFSESELLNSEIAMGIFALYVVAVSTYRLMAEEEFPRLTAMKKLWGRTRGLTFHFLTSVALPMVLGVVFLCEGISDFGGGGQRVSLTPTARWMNFSPLPDDYQTHGFINDKSVLSEDASGNIEPDEEHFPAYFYWSVPPP